MDAPLTTLKSMLKVGWTTKAGHQSPVEREELITGKPTSNENKPCDSDQADKHGYLDTGAESLSVAQVVERGNRVGPTHPLSPGVLSEFPPFAYTTPPACPQPPPLETDLAMGMQTLGQKVLPLAPTLGQDNECS